MNSDQTIVVMRCPKCGEYEETGYVAYMRGLRPMCDYCNKVRMRKATDEEAQAYKTRWKFDGR